MKAQAKRILYLQYSDPRFTPPLLNSARIYANCGWRVLFLGNRTEKSLSQGIANSIDGNNIKTILFHVLHIQHLASFHIPLFTLWCVIHLLYFRPSWVYISNAHTCISAYFLKKIFKFKIIFHEHDITMLQNQLKSKIIQFVRRKIIQQADILIAPNYDQLKKEYADHKKSAELFCVFNCPRMDEINGIKTALSRGGSMKIYYHGGLFPEILPDTLLYALARLPRQIQLIIFANVHQNTPAYIKHLRTLAKKLKIDQQLVINETVSRSKALQECSKCDVGLVFQPLETSNSSLKYMLGASNKQFDYLACGLPLLVSDLKGWKVAYVETGMALSCSPKCEDSIAMALLWYWNNPEKRSSMGKLGRNNIIKKWNYEHQFSPVLNSMTKNSSDEKVKA